ncbi:MAG: hypothetical protein GYB65_03445 [Chloroflexi bacterium]|nr:hypothetical protein [Chloroflexota bacterium]
MIRELNRLTLALLAGFGVVALVAVYWSVVRAETLRERGDNLRNVHADQRLQRGAIFDRDAVPLAYSVPDESGMMQRIYPDPAVAGAVGYFSLDYGAAGIEGAFDNELRGDDVRSGWEEFVDETLHRDPSGSDVRSTLDLDVQQAAAAALGDRQGAVVVVAVPSGAILALVSQPGIDPNRAEADIEALLPDDETAPLLNRVTTRRYPPGGALQTVVLAALLSADPDVSEAALSVMVPDAAAPVTLALPDEDGDTALTLACLVPPETETLTLAEAYSRGCPAPFALAPGNTLDPVRLWERFAAFHLLEPPVLAGFDLLPGEPTLLPVSELGPDTLQAEAGGQGTLLVTPLHMLQVVVAIANGGNAVPLHLVDAVRPPDADGWHPVSVPLYRPALLRADVAQVLRLAMLQAAAQNPLVGRARQGEMVVYGHSALAYDEPDETPVAWFVGFADTTERDEPAALAVVVVIEDEPDPGAAADVAGSALFAAVQATQPEQEN